MNGPFEADRRMDWQDTGAPDPDGILVIGAGMVGVSVALCLQEHGHDVCLLDRGAPGCGASFGNLGNFGIASCPPLAAPGLPWRIPTMLRDPDSPLKLRWRYAASSFPWFLRLLANCRTSRVTSLAAARQALLDRVHEALDPLIIAAGAESLVRRHGLLFTFESEHAFKAAAPAFSLRQSNGVRMELLDGAQARQHEPALSNRVCRAWFVPDLAHTPDPEALVLTLARLFLDRGGTFLRRSVLDVSVSGGRATEVATDRGRVPVGQLVLAAGAWSGPMAARVGARVPLIAERGYHTQFTGTEEQMRIPVISVDRSVAVTPMRGGVRAGGFAEFAPPDAPPDMRNARVARRHAEILMPGLRAREHSEWMGPRPSMPDSLPVIGQAPAVPNAWLAFGHDHLGLTLGAITGRLLAQLIAGGEPPVDPTPYSPRRFGGAPFGSSP